MTTTDATLLARVRAEHRAEVEVAIDETILTRLFRSQGFDSPVTPESHDRAVAAAVDWYLAHP